MIKKLDSIEIQARQLADDDSANGIIEPSRYETVVKSYVNWLRHYYKCHVHH